MDPRFIFKRIPAPSRQIDPDLREMIDRAVAEGRVKRIERGVSAFPLPVYNAVTGNLDSPPPPAKLRRRIDKVRIALNAERADKARIERMQIVALHEREGLSLEQVAERLERPLRGVRASYARAVAERARAEE